MRIRTCLLVLTGLFGALCFPAAASAHVLIADTKNTTGAILHLSPNDDPVAGAKSGIFFDVQTSEDLSKAALHLQITNDSGGTDSSVLVSGNGHTVSGTFVFPTRDLYHMELTIGQKVGGPSVTPLVFRYSVRVTAGAGSSQKTVTPAWAVFGLVMSVWGLITCVLVFVLRRRTILGQSK